MLQIYIYGKTEQGFLDINPDTALNMEGVSELFDEDLSAGEFSLPVELPWTDNNRRLLNFAERLQNGSAATYYWKVTVYEDGFPELVNAKMTILEKIGDFKYLSGKFNASISGNKGLFGSIIKNKKLSDLFLGGVVIIPNGNESRIFATDVMKGVYPDLNYLAFAPVAIENFFDTSRPDYNNEFLVKDTVNTIVRTGSGVDDWVFGRPQVSGVDAYYNPILSTTPTSPGQVAAVSYHDADGNLQTIVYKHIDYRTVPFLKLKYVLKQCFEDSYIGYKVQGAIFDNADFDNVYLFNNYSIEQYNLSTFTDYNNLIIPGNHVPNTTIKEFLKNVFSWLNIYPVFDGSNNTVTLYYRVKAIATKNSIDITDKVVDNFDALFDSETQNQGYTLKYSFDSNDNYHTDRIKERSIKENNTVWIGDKQLVATVATEAALGSLNIGRQLTTADCAYVAATNLYYSVANATVNPILWDVYAEALEDYVYGNGQRNVQINLSPLCTYVEYDHATALNVKRNYVGTRQQGSYVNDKGTRVKADFGLSIFYINKQTINGNNIPTSFNHNRDTSNNVIVPYSFALKGIDGIGDNFHSAWQKLKDKGFTVKTSIIMDKLVKKQLDDYYQLEINGVLYLIYKTERNVPQKEPMIIWLVPV